MCFPAFYLLKDFSISISEKCKHKGVSTAYDIKRQSWDEGMAWMMRWLPRTEKRRQKLFERRILFQYQLLQNEWKTLLYQIEQEGPENDELWERYQVAEEEYCEIIRYFKRLNSQHGKRIS